MLDGERIQVGNAGGVNPGGGYACLCRGGYEKAPRKIIAGIKEENMFTLKMPCSY